jgi:type IV pilus assembly protein PilF
MRVINDIRSGVFILLCLSLTGCGNHWLPLSHSAPSPQKAEINMRLGLAYLQAGDNQRAKEKLLQAEQQSPQSATIKSAIGYFFTCIGEWEHAKTYHLKALSLDRDAPAVHNNYGTFLCQRKRYTEAETHFLMAAKNNHYINTAIAYENAGLCMLKAGRKQDAIGYLNKALTQNRNLEKSWFGLAQLYYQENNYTQAKACWDHYQHLMVQPSAEALWLGIQLSTHFNQLEQAQKYAIRLHTQYPHSVQYATLVSTYPELAHTKKSLYL